MPFTIDGLVILPDHIHTLWRMPDGDNDFSSRWREIKKAASLMIQPTSDHNNERQVWQRRFYEHLIRDEEDWQRHMDYIHYNPVKHRLAESPDQWRWSSFHRSIERGWYKSDWGSTMPQNIINMNLE